MDEYRTRIAEGLCVRCGKPAPGPAVKCASCADRLPEARPGYRVRYERAKSQGVCTTCESRPAKPGRISCEECTRRSAVRMAKKRARRKEDGACMHCGQRMAAHGRNCCAACAAKIAAGERGRNTALRRRRREAGLCTECGGARDREGRIVCAACAAKIADQRKRLADKRAAQCECPLCGAQTDRYLYCGRHRRQRAAASRAWRLRSRQ